MHLGVFGGEDWFGADPNFYVIAWWLFGALLPTLQIGAFVGDSLIRVLLVLWGVHC